MSKPEPLPPDGRFGPVERGGRPRSGGPDWRRLGLFGLVVLTVLGLGAATTAGALVYVSQSAIEDVEVPALRSPGAPTGSAAGPEGGQPDVEPITDILNVLVVGSDSREGLSDEQLLRLGTEDEAGDLTDTVMLMQLDPAREQVSVLSFPRDLRLTRCDGSVGRVNAAYSIGEREGTGGPECLVTTISDFTGIPIDHFVRVKLAGFVDVVDALGGVTMYLEEPLRDRYAGLDLPAGCVTLDGIQALSFVRARRLDDDFGRIARQQRFMREVVREATSVGTLVNLPKLFSLVRAAGRAVETDKGLDLATQRRIAYTLRSITEDNLDLRTVPGTPRLISGAAYVVAREDQAEQLFAAFRDGELPPEDLGREAPTALTAAEVPPLRLLNGAGVAGLAGDARRAFEERGFTVSATGNADSFEFETTQVVYAPDQQAEAELVAAALPGASLVPGEAGEPLTVVLADDIDFTALPEPEATPTPDATAPDEDDPDARAPDEDDPDATAPDEDDPDGTPAPSPTEERQFAGASDSGVRC